jgi:hypothetical protein
MKTYTLPATLVGYTVAQLNFGEAMNRFNRQLSEHIRHFLSMHLGQTFTEEALFGAQVEDYASAPDDLRRLLDMLSKVLDIPSSAALSANAFVRWMGSTKQWPHLDVPLDMSQAEHDDFVACFHRSLRFYFQRYILVQPPAYLLAGIGEHGNAPLLHHFENAYRQWSGKRVCGNADVALQLARPLFDAWGLDDGYAAARASSDAFDKQRERNEQLVLQNRHSLHAEHP